MESTVTAVLSRIRSVTAAIAASTSSGAESTKSGAVVLAEGDHVQPRLVGIAGLGDQVREPLPGGNRPAVAE